ncbi:hypothetical protein VNI00_015932 [Paramarasmius palmivorus]|uniref:Zinc finger C3HC4 RING-type domain-containing protein n=1 Tax=Paramarasmius palmivorus TaxID=297713 RepID=A0AAW0BH72_9AGAR
MPLQQPRKSTNTAVIQLSSDDEGQQITPSRQMLPGSMNTTSTGHSIIELSSDDEDGPKVISLRKRKPPFEDLRQEVKRLRGENDSLLTQRDLMAESVQNLTEKLTTSQSGLEESEERVRSASAQVERLQRLVQTLEENHEFENKERQRQIHGLQGQLKRNEHLVDNTQRTVGRLTAELVSEAAKYKSLKVDTDAMRQHNDVLNNQISELRSSNLDIKKEDLHDSVSLPECGHTFCFACLERWFNTAKDAHKQAYPHWDTEDPNRDDFDLPRSIRRAARSAEQASDILPDILALAPPQPKYSCPSCRARVRFRPVEVFSFKTVSQAVALSQPEEPSTVEVTQNDFWKSFWPNDGTGWREVIRLYQP